MDPEPVYIPTGETSLSSYTFIYNWRISDLETQLLNKPKLNSPIFSSPSGIRPATKWMLTIFNGNSMQTPPLSADEQSLSAELKRQSTINSVLAGASGRSSRRPAPVPQYHTMNDDSRDVWVEAKLRSQSSRFDNLTEFEAASFSQGPTKVWFEFSKPPTESAAAVPCSQGSSSDSSGSSDPSVITFKQCLPLFKVQDSQSIMVKCEIKVSSKEPQPPTSLSLSKFMEEARLSNLLTDVTLVADGKEFKAHKVILASQSQFFKTRFSSRWVSPTADSGTSGDRVEMTDVSVVIMEAILSYVYTGKVADIGKIADQLLPVAEEYGMVGLRKVCEEDLIQSLTSITVINTLIHAAAHNAPDLKKACIEFVVHNTAAVRKSEGWSKLKKDQTNRDLWVELLENIAENH